MIYYTGDIHGDPYEVIQFCDSKKLTEQDTLVLLGDVGANYYRNRRDTEMKRVLAAVKPTMLCIHGNHEIRPASIPSYRTKQWNGGTVWVSSTSLFSSLTTIPLWKSKLTLSAAVQKILSRKIPMNRLISIII